MKKSLLTGAIAASTLAGSLAFSETASAFTLKTCNAIPLGAQECQYVDPITGGGGLEFAADPSVFSTSGPGARRNVNVNNVRLESEGGQESFFDLSDWVAIGKIETKSGSFDLTSQWSEYRNIMAILKDGANSTLIGLLITPNQDSFDWSGNPWATATDLRGGDISYVQFYGSVIPTPGAVLPGLIGMGAAAFRKKKQGEEVAQDA